MSQQEDDRFGSEEASLTSRRGSILAFLLDNLKSSNPRVRALAIRDLGDHISPMVINKLIALARHDPDLHVRCQAITGLGNCIYRSGLSAYDPETDLDAARADERLSQIDCERIYESLLDIYRDQERTLLERRRAVEALSFFSNETVEEVIADLYSYPDKSARCSALVAMGRNGSARWVQVLRKEMSSPDRKMRIEAINAAGELGLDCLGKDLWRLTYSEDKEIMLAAIWSLGQTGWDGAFDRLDELTLHQDPEVRQVADEAMEEWMFYNGLESGYYDELEEEADEWEHSW